MSTAPDIKSALHQATTNVLSDGERRMLDYLADQPTVTVTGERIGFIVRRINERLAQANAYEESADRAKEEGADLEQILTLRREAKTIRATAEAQANALRTLFAL